MADLVRQFFAQIECNKKITKAEALKEAQKYQIHCNVVYQHPYFWSGYVLIGGWQ